MNYCTKGLHAFDCPVPSFWKSVFSSLVSTCFSSIASLLQTCLCLQLSNQLFPSVLPRSDICLLPASRLRCSTLAFWTPPGWDYALTCVFPARNKALNSWWLLNKSFISCWMNLIKCPCLCPQNVKYWVSAPQWGCWWLELCALSNLVGFGDVSRHSCRPAAVTSSTVRWP